jgi:hypothetical protein
LEARDRRESEVSLNGEMSRVARTISIRCGDGSLTLCLEAESAFRGLSLNMDEKRKAAR